MGARRQASPLPNATRVRRSSRLSAQGWSSWLVFAFPPVTAHASQVTSRKVPAAVLLMAFLCAPPLLFKGRRRKAGKGRCYLGREQLLLCVSFLPGLPRVFSGHTSRGPALGTGTRSSVAELSQAPRHLFLRGVPLLVKLSLVLGISFSPLERNPSQMFLSITSLELSVLNTEGLVTEDIKSVPLKCEFFAGISLRASISHGLRMSVPFSGFKMCVQENCPELPGLLSCQDEPERPPGSAPPTTESKQKVEARTTETGGTGAMRGAGRRALEPGTPPRPPHGPPAVASSLRASLASSAERARGSVSRRPCL